MGAGQVKAVKNILILGGYGRAGLEIAKLLLRESEHNIDLAGRDFLKATSTAKECNWEYGGQRVRGVEINVAFKKRLTSLMEDYDLVIDSIPFTAFGGQIARAALDTGIDYLDLTTNKEKLLSLKGLDVEIQVADLTFITKAGFVPGTASLMARYLEGYFDSVDTVKSSCLLSESPRSYRDCDDLIPTRDDSPTVYGDGPGFKRPFDGALTILRGSWLGKLLGIRGHIPEHRQICALMATATGVMNGRMEKLDLTVKHGDFYRATALTSIPCILGILDGSIRQPGVHTMGHVMDPDQYLDDLWRMGMTVSLQGLPETWDENSQQSECRLEKTVENNIGLIEQVA